MALTPGTRLGVYEVVASIGEGGMGQVFRARDTKLDRTVAIKILPEAFAHDADRLARFQREAKTLASLNHPNIAAIYGLEESGGMTALVMELVEGDDLSQRIARGAIPLDEALPIAKQIAEALEAAHEQGVIHRDLKPANIKVRPDGMVKVLDFGLAKAMEPGRFAAELSTSPTITAPAMTQAGVILGTAAYMSPEQARGKTVDKRSDIWAFGTVLYEMLTGRVAFAGETLSDTIAAILERDPDWSMLERAAPLQLVRVIQRCLQKDPKDRTRDIGDVRLELDDHLGASVRAGALVQGPIRRTIPLSAATLVVVVATALVGGGVWFLKPSPPRTLQGPLDLAVALPSGEQLVVPTAMVAVASDGTHLAYAAQRGPTSRLYVRALDRGEIQPLPGTEGATGPFFSPDGKWIGFFAGGKLKKISISGGAALTICDASSGKGGAWGMDDNILFSPSTVSGLWQVSSSGGTPQPLTTLDRRRGEVNHRWPQILPGGKAVLFTVSNGPGEDEQQIELQTLATGERRVVVPRGRVGRYVSTGHLVYLRQGKLLAVAFDPVRLEVTASAPVPVAANVWDWTESSAYAVSDTGSLVYVPGIAWRPNELVWVDRSGKTSAVGAPPGFYSHPRLSPDGRQVAVQVMGPTEDIWIYDLMRSTSTRFTSEEGSAQRPVWTPDGARIAYRLSRAGFRTLFWKSVDGSGPEQQFTKNDAYETPDSWSPDGKILTFSRDDPKTGSDVWVLRMDRAAAAEPFLQTPFFEGLSRVSPDGRWLAYVSNESGRNEVYVRPFPTQGGRWLISTDGGSNPVWAQNGRALFYRNGNQILVVEVNAHLPFTAGKPRELFEGRYETAPDTNYDVTRDGQQFLMVKEVEPRGPITQLNIILNWSEELKRLMPAN